MPEKQQIIPVSLFASCETYNCRKKVAWAIGRPDGPRQLWNYYCDGCMKDIVANIPTELLADKDTQDAQSLVVTIREQLEADNLNPEDIKTILDMFVNRGLLTRTIDQDESKGDQDQQEPEIKSGTALELLSDAKGPKTYTCKYCEAPFDSPGALGNHVRRCPKKGVE